MKRVLLTPLDWGLGHATRCVPLVKELVHQGCEVIIAGNGNSLELLRKEFPGHSFYLLPAYAPRYPERGSMVMTMAAQLPRFVSAITREHKVAEELIEKANIDMIISDNRYGCWSEKIPSVLITHQSNILMPKRFGFLQWPVRKLTGRMMKRFDRCWIPDYPEGDSLAGALVSYDKVTPAGNVDFIGWLSRFEPHTSAQVAERDVLVICSGPEPQRTLFEKMMTPQLERSGLRFRLVRGLPSATERVSDERFVNFLTARELQASIETSSVVIARSGYSTVMDMHALGKKAIFVPTPGQTEQEYLARRLMEKGIAFFMRQDEFDLTTALERNAFYSGFPVAKENVLLRQAVTRLLKDPH